MNELKDNKHQINFGKYIHTPLKVEKIEDTKYGSTPQKYKNKRNLKVMIYSIHLIQCIR